jgi:hypothetical protein
VCVFACVFPLAVKAACMGVIEFTDFEFRFGVCCAFIVRFGRSPNAAFWRVQLDFGGAERVLLMVRVLLSEFGFCILLLVLLWRKPESERAGLA